MQGLDEIETTERCVDCGAEIATGSADRSFAVTDDDVLCYECALRRGGSWDELHARWSTPPRIDDLSDRVAHD